MCQKITKLSFTTIQYYLKKFIENMNQERWLLLKYIITSKRRGH